MNMQNQSVLRSPIICLKRLAWLVKSGMSEISTSSISSRKLRPMNSAVCHPVLLYWDHRLTRRIEAFGLQGPEAYAYTSLSNCLQVEGINDNDDFADTLVSPS